MERPYFGVRVHVGVKVKEIYAIVIGCSFMLFHGYGGKDIKMLCILYSL